MDHANDTICAIVTSTGGAVGMIRISGETAFDIGDRVWHGRCRLSELPARQLILGQACSADGSQTVLDPECLAVRMPGPNSYTGEDVVELHCHGGALCVRMVLQTLLAAGARMAEPGEFTLRAFMNGRIDLTQAEAVADMIAASSQSALRLAGSQLRGRLGKRISFAYETLCDILSDIESQLDFSEEDLEFTPLAVLLQRVQEVQTEIDALLATRAAGEILRNGVRLAIVGCPNVGKSSLLNAILGRDRAIVTAVPGTTRDTIEEYVSIRDIPVHLVDTAGIRDSADAIEQTGMERAKNSAADADIVLWLYDATQPYAPQAWPEWDIRGQLLVVGNKADALPNGVRSSESTANHLCISALTGEGLDALYDAIERLVGLSQTDTSGDIGIAARHAALLEDAQAALRHVTAELSAGTCELAAVGLRNAIAALGNIIGREVDPDILHTIFSKFCIGK